MTVKVHWEEKGAGQRMSCRDLQEAGSLVMNLCEQGIPEDVITIDLVPLKDMPFGWWHAK